MDYLEKLKKILPEEHYNKVVKDIGEGKKLFVNDGKNYIDIASFNTKNDELKTANDQITTLKQTISDTTTKLSDFSKLEGATEDLKTQITTLTESNKTLVSDSDKKLSDANEVSEKKLNETIMSSKIDLGLIASGSTSVASQKAIRANIDMSKLSVKEDKLEGLDDQLKTLKESNSALFFGEKSTKQETKKITGTNFIKGNLQNEVDGTAEDKISTMYKDQSEAE